jgi:GNAT superfamily N-acetyltransferase
MYPCLPSLTTADGISEQVYASYRHLGIGAIAIQEMERRARAFGATHTTFNTMAVERHLRVFKEELGYIEYKSRSATYSVADVVGAGFPPTYQVAAFLEKAL